MSNEQRKDATPQDKPAIIVDKKFNPPPLTQEEQAYLDRLEAKSRTYNKNLRFK